MTRQIHHRLMKTLGVALTAATLLCGTSLAAANEFKSKKLGGTVAANTATTVSDTTAASTKTVTDAASFLSAVHDNTVSEIQVSGTITLPSESSTSDTSSTDSTSTPVYFDTPKTITTTNSGTLYFHGSIELGADVTFKNMSVIFNSSTTPSSNTQRPIFLNGYSLTFNNINTWLECTNSNATSSCPSGQSSAIAPSVYGGSSTSTQNQSKARSKTQGDHAQLVVTNARVTSTSSSGSTDSTSLQVVNMSKGESDATSYSGKASVTLDARTTVTNGINTAGNSESSVTLNASGTSNSTKLGTLTGGTNSTLTLNKANQSNPVFDIKVNDFTNTVLDGVTFKPLAESTFTNLTLPKDSVLDLSSTGNKKYLTAITLDGNLDGGGTMRVSYSESRITVKGNVSGTTTVTPSSSTLFQGIGYITAPNATSSSFSTGKTDVTWAQWGDGAWMVANVDSWTTEPTISGWTENIETPSNPQGAAKYGTVTYSYKVKGAEDSTYTTTKPTAAGSYVMRAEVKEGKVKEGVYTAGLTPKCVEFTITADPTPTITSATTLLDGAKTSSFTYGDTITVQVSTKNIADNDTITLATEDGTNLAEGTVTSGQATLTLNTSDKALAVGTHQLHVQHNSNNSNSGTKASSTNDSNGQASANLAALTVNARKLTPTLSGTASKEYDRTTAISAEQGANLTLSVQDGDVLADDAEAIAVTGDFTFASANAGDVQVHASNLAITSKTRGVDAASFYTLTTTRVSANVGTITPKTVQIQWANTDNRTEGDGLGAVKATVAGLVGDDTVTAVVEDGEAHTAGKYTARVSGLTGTHAGNYALPADGTGTTVTFSVANKTAETTKTDDTTADMLVAAASESVTSETGAAVAIVAVAAALLILMATAIAVAATLKR